VGNDITRSCIDDLVTSEMLPLECRILSRVHGSKDMIPRRIFAVLGMHRSGTSAVVGMLEQQGISLGQVWREIRDQPRGSLEDPEIYALHEGVLAHNRGTWWRPPTPPVRFTRRQHRRRDKILSKYPGRLIAVKDPRLLVLRDFWRDVELERIGVIRNPVAVRRSLQARARLTPDGPELSDAEWERLWCVYNRALLEERERAAFPVVNFDLTGQLAEQMHAALSYYEIGCSGHFDFFSPDLISNRVPPAGWQSQVAEPATIPIWEALTRYSSELS
jgi:hypothetical protein